MNADLEKKFLLCELPEQREKIYARAWCPDCRTKFGRPRYKDGALKQTTCETCNRTGMVDGSGVVVGAS